MIGRIANPWLRRGILVVAWLPLLFGVTVFGVLDAAGEYHRMFARAWRGK